MNLPFTTQPILQHERPVLSCRSSSDCHPRGIHVNMLSVPKRFRHYSDRKMSLCFKIPIKSDYSKWKIFKEPLLSSCQGEFSKGRGSFFPQQCVQQRIATVCTVIHSKENILISWITFTISLYQVAMLTDKISIFQSENYVYCWYYNIKWNQF